MKRKHCSKCGNAGHNARTCEGGKSGGAKAGKGARAHIAAIKKHTSALEKSLGKGK